MQLRAAADRFALDGCIVSAAPHGLGHVHATYLLETRSSHGHVCRYILQRVNRRIFPDPEMLMQNTERVIAHLERQVCREGRDRRREVPTLLCTHDGQSFVQDDDGEVWRCFEKIEGTATFPTMTDPDGAGSVAGAFGRFLRRMANFAPEQLQRTIPRFHDAAHELDRFREVLKEDPLGRANAAVAESEFIERHADLTAAWSGLLSSGRLAVRAIHNDTKVDNVLIEQATGYGVCVIDLDTVMAGCVPIDIGDCARSILTGPEEIGQPMDMRLFKAVVRGFADELGEQLDDVEIGQIVLATRAIALELGTRFLADFLVGDRWFPVERRSQNLERCRVQLDLVGQIETHVDEMTEIVHRETALAHLGGSRGVEGSPK